MNDAPTKPELDTDHHFAEITKNFHRMVAGEQPDDNRVTVLLDLPHLANYGRSTQVELVYGCTFPVALGDAVECPPTPRGPDKWTVGVVVALDGRGYAGPVKYVRKVASTTDG